MGNKEQQLGNGPGHYGHYVGRALPAALPAAMGKATMEEIVGRTLPTV